MCTDRLQAQKNQTQSQILILSLREVFPGAALESADCSGMIQTEEVTFGFCSQKLWNSLLRKYDCCYSTSKFIWRNMNTL